VASANRSGNVDTVEVIVSVVAGAHNVLPLRTPSGRLYASASERPEGLVPTLKICSDIGDGTL
jgi:hypothetical protein